jgi:hypothetical protein
VNIEFYGQPDEFEFLVGDINWRDFWGKWISQKYNNGDWDYWIVIEINNVEELGRESDCTHIVFVSSVSPEAAGKKNIEMALGCCGIDLEKHLDEDRNVILDQISDEMIVEALHTYGISALLWSDEGNDPDELLQAAKEQATAASSLFGFYMDGPKNRLGHTGWDFIRGDLSIDTAMANRKGWAMWAIQ